MIKIENLNFKYDDKKVLDNISFEIQKGEKIALLGCNGSGKSTILRILAGLYFSDGYFFEGKKISKKVDKTFRQKIAVLFQNPESMIFNPTVYDEIAFSLREFDLEVSHKVENISKIFGIEKLLDKNPLNLSGGEKQKVILAALLVYEPQLLLLDEATSAMDPRTTGWLIDFLINLDKTIVFATHDLAVAYEICDRAIVLDENHQKIYDGDIECLFANRDLLIQANLIYPKTHTKRKFIESKYHFH